MTTKDFQLPFAPDTDIGFVSGFVIAAGRFDCKIEIYCNDKCFDAKSFLGLTYAGIFPGDNFTLCAEGADEQEALDQLSTYMNKYR